MKSLYIRIYLTLVALLLAFAFASAWLFQRQIEHERGLADAQANERLASIGVLIHHALPPADAPAEAQADALREWGQRLRIAVALIDAKGSVIGASDLYARRADEPGAHPVEVDLEDGRKLMLVRAWRPPPGFRQAGPGAGQPGPRTVAQRDEQMALLPFGALTGRPSGEALLVVLVLLFLGVALGAYPVVRRLTRRLEALKVGVEHFGAGDLNQRVDDRGGDEVAAVARSFNAAAARVQTLMVSQKHLLANASHELRSPLARLKMAFSMLEETDAPAARARLGHEIHTNIGELDALVEEVLLASRLEADPQGRVLDSVDLIALGAEESARVGAEFESASQALRAMGEERLLRRALRNLLENARRYGGGGPVELELAREGDSAVMRVLDRGPGVPEAMRERIFEAFFRLPGHAEQAGGVGLGLALVKQIAARHGGSARCDARAGGGSVFELRVPAL
ncbi:MAG: HAMP domain-containing histidine kinase [Pelomonas sp.]|nr:HAMP domain-containing histidine kinase [Roseateles sp.]